MTAGRRRKLFHQFTLATQIESSHLTYRAAALQRKRPFGLSPRTHTRGQERAFATGCFGSTKCSRYPPSGSLLMRPTMNPADWWCLRP